MSRILNGLAQITYLSTRPNTVILDPGHGGNDKGYIGKFGAEKDYTLKVARMTRDILQKRGYRVVMTRDSDVAMSEGERAKIVNKYPHAICISIHFNSGKNGEGGVETYVMSPIGVPHPTRSVRKSDFSMRPGNTVDSASIALATGVHSRVLLYLNNPKGNNFKMPDLGIKRARYQLLEESKIPTVRIVAGDLSVRYDAEKMQIPVYQKTMAAAIARGADVYKNSIAQRRRR